MSIALMIGVLLISGVVAPVIANVSSNGDGGGSGVETDISGYDRYAKVTDSTDVTIYPYYYIDTEQYGYSYTNPSEPDAETHILYGSGMVIGEGWSARSDTTGTGSDMIGVWAFSWDGEDYKIYEFHLTGNSTVATGVITNTTTQVTLDLPASIYYPSPDGQFVSPVKGDGYTEPYTYLPFYANSNSEVFCEIYYDGEDTYWYIDAVGTISDNTAWLDGPEEVPFTDSVAFTIENGLVTGATVTVDGNTYDVTLPSEWEEDEEISGSILLLPVSVYEGGDSEGSGLSPTLTTVLSVIPLILTVGLVIGAIGFLRMKN